jgi:dTDP-glucose 4,6-dehydratase
MDTILVTGGAGFIGSHFVRRLLREYPSCRVVNVDKLTYAGSRDNLRDVEGDPRHRFVEGDICDRALMDELVGQADAIVSFAAETHVDRSLLAADDFIRTDVHGTYVLLCAAREHDIERFVYVSTDEVYGEVPEGYSSREDDPLRPRNPYAASKAAADLLCLSFAASYDFPVIVTRAVNTIGPCQYPEKAVPLFITNALSDEALPLYGDGRQVRDWLFVEDHCRAVDLLMRQGMPGEVYNIGAGNHRRNVEMAEAILSHLDKPRDLIRHVPDRPGHDRRYSLDWSKIGALGWSPQCGFEEALARTVEWYRDNEWWWRKARSGDYREYYERQYGWRLQAAAGHAGGEAEG